jgi:diguanylate cyclase (GGDEF)-like protein
MNFPGGRVGAASGSESPSARESSRQSKQPSKQEVDGRQPLTQVRQVHALAAEEAARSLPVHLVGVATALSGYRHSFFFQDATGGIDVESNIAAVKVGDRVELTGTTGTGFFAPIVIASETKVVGTAPLPPPRPVAFADLMGGAQDSQWIEVRGIIHSAAVSAIYDHPTLILSVDIGGGTMRVLLQQFAADDPTRLIDATVRFRGVCISDFNEKRQFVGLGLLVSHRSDIEILEPSPLDPFAAPTTPVRDALQFGQARHRIKIEGVSTYQVPGRFLYLQDGADGIRVRTSATQIVPPGQRVEAIGFPVSGEYSPVLSDGFLRVVGNAAPVAPTPIQADKVITQPGEFTHVDHDQQLVQVKGEVVESRTQGGQRIWTLRQNGKVFDAYLPLSSLDKKADGLGVGSILSITGICAVQVDFDRNPTSFGILLRSPQDIVVLRRMSWWTPGHLLLAVAALAAAVLAAVLWVALLRMRVQQMTHTLVESEQRFRHMATHDGLTQLANRNAILATLNESLEAAGRLGTGVCVAILDLDHFKRVNDTYGHAAGDEVLREAAKRLSSAIRESDAIGRYGGEEFLIVFRNMDEMIGRDRCEHVRLAVCRKPVVFQGEELAISCSIGMSGMRGSGTAADKLIANADEALYKAKKGGRNRVEIFVPESEQLASLYEQQQGYFELPAAT